MYFIVLNAESLDTIHDETASVHSLTFSEAAQHASPHRRLKRLKGGLHCFHKESYRSRQFKRTGTQHQAIQVLQDVLHSRVARVRAVEHRVAHAPVGRDVAVLDRHAKANLGRRERVVGREVDVERPDTALPHG